MVFIWGKLLRDQDNLGYTVHLNLMRPPNVNAVRNNALSG